MKRQRLMEEKTHRRTKRHKNFRDSIRKAWTAICNPAKATPNAKSAQQKHENNQKGTESRGGSNRRAKATLELRDPLSNLIEDQESGFIDNDLGQESIPAIFRRRCFIASSLLMGWNRQNLRRHRLPERARRGDSTAAAGARRRATAAVKTLSRCFFIAALAVTRMDKCTAFSAAGRFNNSHILQLLYFSGNIKRHPLRDSQHFRSVCTELYEFVLALLL